MIPAREINRTEPAVPVVAVFRVGIAALPLLWGSATIGDPHPAFTDPARVAQGIEQPPPKR